MRLKRRARGLGPAWALALVMALGAGLAASSTSAQTMPTPVPLVLAVTVNGEARPDLFVQRLPDGRLLARRDDLPSLGLLAAPPAALTVDGEPHVALDAIDGLHSALDERTLALTLTAQARLLSRSVLDARPRRHRAEAVGSHGAFLNWALAHSSRRGAADNPDLRDTRVALEAGARQGAWLLLGNGHTVTEGAHRRFVRLMASAQLDQPQQLRRWSLGDTLTSAPALAGSVNLGGLALTKHEGMDPYRLRYPQGAVQGQASLPSEVEVYVDGQRVRTERVRPGEFEIRDLTTQQGARAVQVLVRDPFGRVRQYDYALYTSDQLLPRGEHDYQYALGALRSGYGSSSFDYGAPAFSGWHRWGASDALTLGGHVQARAGLLNVGGLSTATLGTAGVLSLGVAASQAGGQGAHAALAQYGYYASRWGLGGSLRHESPGYAMLGESRTLSNRAWGAALHASRTLPDGGVLSLSRTRDTAHAMDQVRVPAGWQLASSEPRRGTTLAYARSWPSLRGSLRIAAARLHDSRGGRSELTVGLTMSLDGPRLLSMNTRHGDGGSVQSVQLSQPLPPGEGWGWEVGADRNPTTRWHGAAQLNARHLQWRGELQRRTGAGAASNEMRLAASGAMAWIGGGWHLSRPVQDAHALVQVGDLEGVPVRVNGLAMGVTDARGQLFVPQLGAWQETEFTIDARRIPIDQSVPRVSRRVVLPERGGAVIDFQARRLQAVIARLVRPGAGQPVPLPQAVVRLRPDMRADTQDGPPPQVPAAETITGREGEIYLENLPAGTYRGQADADGAGTTGSAAVCRFTLRVPASDEVVIDAGDLPCE